MAKPNQSAAKTTKATKKANTSELKSKVYEIPLAADAFSLTKEKLIVHADHAFLKKKRRDYPILKFLSVKNNVLCFFAEHDDWKTKVIIQAEADKLCVSCSCGMAEGKLCLHAAKTLERIIDSEGEDYFEQFRPGGLSYIGLQHPAILETKIKWRELYFTPKKSFGTVYYYSGHFLPATFADMLNLPGASPDVYRKADKALAYVMLFPRTKWQKVPPFLLPCQGLLNKEGSAIKLFEPYFSGTGKGNAPHFFAGQEELNALCREMWKAAENTKRSFLEDDKENLERLQSLFNLWEQAIPVLQQQPYLYRHPFFYLRQLKEKPMKSYLEEITVSTERPKLSFRLSNKGECYLLDLKVGIRGKNISDYEADVPFFVEKNECYYLAASLRDAAMLEWMGKMGLRITILKEHFTAFESVYLSLLKEYYPVNTR